jgi:putative membrane protein insertion efficiency factor
MKYILKKMILFYKRHISPSLGKVCIYTPTCSMYTMDAIERYGAIRGSIKGFFRILRCNPFAKGGFDPVKENLRGNVKWTL